MGGQHIVILLVGPLMETPPHDASEGTLLSDGDSCSGLAGHRWGSCSPFLGDRLNLEILGLCGT